MGWTDSEMPSNCQLLILTNRLYLVFLSPDYLSDLQGRNDDDSNGSWEFYGSSVCGELNCSF